ncbi:MAG: nickel pincer cofactor biosynthesis protein LarC [Bacteroidales bacterium]|nr:nickel pincer cofactor biosynthesis protein LarC [Bacteroidales bacterium]
MKILYYECFSGISGDMNLGAMIDIGVEELYLRNELSRLNLKGWELAVEKEKRHGITGTKVTVIPTREEHHHRHPGDIEKIIEESTLSGNVKRIASAIFREVALAESKVHDIPYESVHFHEVGAVDSIIDIVGAAICYDRLGIDKVHISTLELGGGMVKCAHGVLPVPAPATIEIVRGLPVITGGVSFEATTPTGAAIVKALGTSFGAAPGLIIEKTGYGIGQKEGIERPNMLRVSVAETVETAKYKDDAFIAECNIDDMNPEWYEYITGLLFKAGASDVWLTPIIMKRNRPATKLSLLCAGDKLDILKNIILRESTTVGLRIIAAGKVALERSIEVIDTPMGKFRIKVSRLDGKVATAKAEFSDCSDAATRNNIPLKDVYRYIDHETSKLYD